jgi:uncharacterized phiE125 gp8 family phage protein
MTVKRIEAPIAPAVSLDDAKLSLRIDGDDLDALVEAWVDGITEYAEHYLGRVLISQKWRVTLPAFPNDPLSLMLPQADAIPLPMPPVISVDSVKYVDTAGTKQTLDGAAYSTVDYLDSVFLVPAAGTSWPAAREQANAVTVDVTCGYGPDDTTVPKIVRTYLLAKLAEQFDPTARLEQNTVQSTFIDRLLDLHKVY